MFVLICSWLEKEKNGCTETFDIALYVGLSQCSFSFLANVQY